MGNSSGRRERGRNFSEITGLNLEICGGGIDFVCGTLRNTHNFTSERRGVTDIRVVSYDE